MTRAETAAKLRQRQKDIMARQRRAPQQQPLKITLDTSEKSDD